MSDTNVAETEGTGTNTSTTEGTGDTAAPNTEKQGKTFTQDELNKLVAKARAEGRDSGKLAALKDYEGKHIFTEEELDARLQAAVGAALKERDLVDVKRTIQAEYGLTDAQLSKLTGDDEKSLKSDAETTFGALRKKDAPQITPGNPKHEVSENEDLNTRLRQTLKRRKI